MSERGPNISGVRSEHLPAICSEHQWHDDWDMPTRCRRCGITRETWQEQEIERLQARLAEVVQERGKLQAALAFTRGKFACGSIKQWATLIDFLGIAPAPECAIPDADSLHTARWIALYDWLDAQTALGRALVEKDGQG